MVVSLTEDKAVEKPYSILFSCLSFKSRSNAVAFQVIVKQPSNLQSFLRYLALERITATQSQA